MRSAPICALFGVALTHCALTATPCAWRGSGLAQQYTAGDSAPPGVTQVTLQCSRGTVEWLYPTDALRVKLFPLTGASSQHGGPTICLKPFTGSHGAVLSIETSEHLKRVISLDDTVPGDKDIFCLGKEAVSSNDGAVVMFIQATPQTDISRRIAAFHFELWPGSLGLKPILGKDGKRESEDVCRPCSREEMLTAACTSEFVAQGEMVSVENVSRRGHMAIYISVQRILKQMDPAFGVSTDSRSRTQEWVLWIPLRCGVKLDTGEFMFIGKMRFGEIWLTCAPWLLDFNRAYLFSQTTGSNPCELKLD